MSTASRREFIAASAVAVAAAPSLNAAGDDVIRVGLIGCGERGTGAAVQALQADKNVKLVALGDAFEDRVSSSVGSVRNKKEVAGKVAEKPGCFIGCDAYKDVIAAADVVLLTTPPHF